LATPPSLDAAPYASPIFLVSNEPHLDLAVGRHVELLVLVDDLYVGTNGLHPDSGIDAGYVKLGVLDVGAIVLAVVQLDRLLQLK
jgi:hypothetical protein